MNRETVCEVFDGWMDGWIDWDIAHIILSRHVSVTSSVCSESISLSFVTSKHTSCIVGLGQANTLQHGDLLLGCFPGCHALSRGRILRRYIMSHLQQA